MKIYFLSDDWTGDIEMYASYENAEARRVERYDEFVKNWRKYGYRQPPTVVTDDFYILEYTVKHI